MNHNQWETVLDHTCQLGEGPVWDAPNERLLWVDILAGEIHSLSVRSREHRVFATGQMVGAITLEPSGKLLAAMQHGFYEVSLEHQQLRQIVDPEAHLPQNRFNDGKSDPAGRFWAGTMSLTMEPGAGKLYMLDQNRNVKVQIEPVTCSNGLAWSHDQKLFYYIDTPTRQVVAYDFDLESGTIQNKRVVIEIPAEAGFPDGMCIDAAGMLWVALWDGWKVVRYNPATGQALSHISLPAARITSCAFGGSRLQDLYITSASTGLSPEQLTQQPLAGSLFVVKAIDL